jgi:ATP-dependent DNA helicase DinG
VIVCHAPSVLSRLKVDPPVPTLDILELFAFARPARFCLPTSRGLADALSLSIPQTLEAEAAMLLKAVQCLLDDLSDTVLALPNIQAMRLKGLAAVMAQSGWLWGAMVVKALGGDGDASRRDLGFQTWEFLPDWSEHAPEPSPGSIPVSAQEARAQLDILLGPNAEQRPAQADYASAVSEAFQPRQVEDEPRLVLAEAGTGTGKTLGYIAPASVWAKRNGAPVWISTYTRNLQRQLDGELDRLYPDPRDKARAVVVRKGRENYLCILNLEERINQRRAPDYPALGIMARWVSATRDGDMVGGDFPAWIADLMGRARTLGLADQRGECIYSACAHYKKCFIERAIRKARQAEIVVANHALVLVQSAMGGIDDGTVPARLVFDEGHHLFDAADSAFSAHLTGLEAAEMRRWILGADSDVGVKKGRSRSRGLKRRVEDLVSAEDQGGHALHEILSAAHVLPALGWSKRLQDGTPHGAAEEFLGLIHTQVMARSANGSSGYDMEAECHPLIDGIVPAAMALDRHLAKMVGPVRVLDKELGTLLDDQASQLDTNTRARIEGIRKSLERRVRLPVEGWRRMLEHLTQGVLDDTFIDWFGVQRYQGNDVDVGMHRHWLDPTKPLAQAVMKSAHGVVVTSATLRDGSGDTELDWLAAERRTGASHLTRPPLRAVMPSPFDYANRTRVLVVTDVRKDDLDQVAAAYRELFLASKGGGLGLFTAISRLRAVRDKIAVPLDDAGIQLLAQHVDRLDTATLVDIFRAEENSCLLGTDAVRDGVDVPGRSLRLIVFDRVPWPRPDILHKTRKAHFGGRTYDDMIARLRLKQAYGRLIRRADDRGIFVLLDPMMPSRLGGAFPDGVEVERVGLAEAVKATHGFFD